MSITDELREWMRVVLTDDSPAYAIADRIDEEHQKAIRELNYLATDSILLPVDADGVPFRIGDKVDSDHHEDGTVTSIQFYEMANGGIRTLLAVRPDGLDVATWHTPDEYRHYQPPTVEDVLREFAERVCNSGHRWGLDAADTIAEYAAKLRLAGDAE